MVGCLYESQVIVFHIIACDDQALFTFSQKSFCEALFEFVFEKITVKLAFFNLAELSKDTVCTFKDPRAL